MLSDTRLVKSNICSVNEESFEKGISSLSYDLELKDQRKVIKEIKTFSHEIINCLSVKTNYVGGVTSLRKDIRWF